VSYTYNIGAYDVTDSQYCTFLDAVDPTGANALSLYAPGGDAEYGITYNSGAANGDYYSVIPGYTDMPAVDVNYWDTLRFCNWMNNGEGSGSTETGAYTLIGDSQTPSNAAALLANPQPNAGATVWLPSEDEWYKAAYYDPANGSYSTYATQSNTAPGNVVGNSPNQANYNNNGYSATQSSTYDPNQNYVTAVGSYTDSASYYGTYDQTGDVLNWNSTVEGSQYPVLRGGAWDADNAQYESSSFRDGDSPQIQSADVGFRVASIASIPEPNVAMLMLVTFFGWAAVRGRRSKI